MASTLALVCIFVPACMLLPNKPVMEGVTPRHFGIIYIGLLALMLLVVGTSAMFLFQPLPNDSTELSATFENPSVQRAVCILVAWLGPLVALLFLPYDATSPTTEMTSFLSTTSDDDDNDSNEYSLCEMLSTFTAWLLCWSCTILVGSGTVLTNNIGQEVEALDLPARAASGCLSIFSVAQSASRVATGAVSEWAFTIKTNGCGIHGGVPSHSFWSFKCIWCVGSFYTCFWNE